MPYAFSKHNKQSVVIMSEMNVIECAVAGAMRLQGEFRCFQQVHKQDDIFSLARLLHRVLTNVNQRFVRGRCRE